MSEKIKASILVITYRQEGQIGRSIESLLRQKCSYPWEIILADDASPDSTRRICEDYAAKYPYRIRMMPPAPNKGLVGNYFDALEAARGEYIGDCAGDDEWLDEERLQKQIEFLDAHPECSVCWCDVEVCRPGIGSEYISADPVKSRFYRPHVKGSELLVGALNHTNYLPYTLSAAMYRKSAIWERYQTDRDMLRNEAGGVEDVPLLAALGAAGDGGYVPIKGYRYYIDGESVSNNLSHEKEYRFYSRVLRLTRRLAEYYGVPYSSLKDHYLSKISHIAAQARHAKRRDLGEEVREIAREWGVPLPVRAKLHLLLLRLGW